MAEHINDDVLYKELSKRIRTLQVKDNDMDRTEERSIAESSINDGYIQDDLMSGVTMTDESCRDEECPINFPHRSPIIDRRPGSSCFSINTEMAILATTSPEIKAMNLPTTPSFPDEINVVRIGCETQSSTVSRNSLGSSNTSEQSWLGVAKVDGGGNIQQDRLINEKDEYSSYQDDSAGQNDKENAQGRPSIIVKQSIHRRSSLTESIGININSQTKVQNFEGHLVNNVNSKSVKPRRRAVHRRVSYDNLPSPQQIDEIVDMSVQNSQCQPRNTMTNIRKASSCRGRISSSGSGPLFFPADMNF